ncbi:MAG: hypothetical protein GX644_03905 [Limnobacter sp.]|nr:hypothetical protein [Limnobacter sp.]
MISTRDLVTLIAAGVVLGAIACSNAQRRRDRLLSVQRRDALQRWEGEGGAVPDYEPGNEGAAERRSSDAPGQVYGS